MQTNKFQHTSPLCQHQCVFSQCTIKILYIKVIRKSILSRETQMPYCSLPFYFLPLFLTYVSPRRSLWSILPIHIHTHVYTRTHYYLLCTGGRWYTLRACYPHFGTSVGYGQVERHTYSMNRFAKNISQTIGELTAVTQSDNACDNDSIYAVRTFSDNPKHIVTQVML